jgi:hypothetical protein
MDVSEPQLLKATEDENRRLKLMVAKFSLHGETLNDVRCTPATWRKEYNCERPHNSLDYLTPRS